MRGDRTGFFVPTLGRFCGRVSSETDNPAVSRHLSTRMCLSSEEVYAPFIWASPDPAGDVLLLHHSAGTKFTPRPTRMGNWRPLHTSEHRERSRGLRRLWRE